MRIICDAPGQTCNRLWTYVASVARCVAERKRMVIIFFDWTIEDFPNLLHCPFVYFPLHQKWYLERGNGWNNYKGLTWKVTHDKRWDKIFRFLGCKKGWYTMDDTRYLAQTKKQLQHIFQPKKEIIDIVGMPCFVKPANDGSSFGVSKVVKPDQLAAAIRKASLESDEVMIEQFLEGTEISIGCYKTKNKSVVFPATEVVSENDFFDYDAKYNGQVKEITPARLPEDTAKRVAEITSHIYDILHCNGIIRIDYIISKDQQISMLEINTTPGMTPTSFIPQQVRAAGLSMTDVLTDIVENQF